MFPDVVHGLATAQKETELVRELVLTLNEAICQLMVTSYPVGRREAWRSVFLEGGEGGER